MNLPDFSEFMDALDEDEMCKAIEEAVQPKIIRVSDIRDPENMAALIQTVYQDAVAAATNVSCLYLQAYHQWLQQHI